MSAPRIIPTSVLSGRPGIDGIDGPPGLPGPGSAAWAASTAVTTGEVRQHTDGSWMRSNATRTTGSTLDATEEGFWTAVLSSPGTFEADALSASIDASVDARVGLDAGPSSTLTPAANRAQVQAALDVAAAAPGLVRGVVRPPGVTYYIDESLVLDSLVKMALRDSTLNLVSGSDSTSSPPRRSPHRRHRNRDRSRRKPRHHDRAGERRAGRADVPPRWRGCVHRRAPRVHHPGRTDRRHLRGQHRGRDRDPATPVRRVLYSRHRRDGRHRDPHQPGPRHRHRGRVRRAKQQRRHHVLRQQQLPDPARRPGAGQHSRLPLQRRQVHGRARQLFRLVDSRGQLRLLLRRRARHLLLPDPRRGDARQVR